MENEQLPVKQVIGILLQPGTQLLNVNLARLSSLGKEDMAYFTQRWREADAGQRLRLLAGLVSLSEDDLALDFSSIFKLGIEDSEENVRITALDGLGLEDKGIFVRLIIQILKGDDAVNVRVASAKVLGKFALMAELDELPAETGQLIFNALLEILENPEEPLEIRRRALESIAPFQQELIYNYIDDYYFMDDPKAKASAIYAMGRNCNPRWLNYLIEEMRSGNDEFKFEAARASGEIEDEEAVPALLNLLYDSDSEVIEAAISALGKIGGDDARQALQKLKDNPDDWIKNAAVSALAELNACEDPLSLNF